MLCPKCHDQVLVPVDRQGIEIDYCPGCRGVWLDRGELDKLASGPAPADFKEAPRAHSDRDREYREPVRSDDRDRDRDRDRRRDWDDDDDKKRRKRSFLEDLLDFD